MSTEQAYVVGGCEDRTTSRLTAQTVHWPRIEERAVIVDPQKLLDADSMAKAVEGGIKLDQYRLEKVLAPISSGDFRELHMYVFNGTYTEGQGHDDSGSLTTYDALEQVFDSYASGPSFLPLADTTLVPLRHMADVIRTVELLNEWGEIVAGEAAAAFHGNQYGLSITWESHLLWEDSGDHLSDIPSDVVEGLDTRKPSFELCFVILKHYVTSHAEWFKPEEDSPHKESGDPDTSNSCA